MSNAEDYIEGFTKDGDTEYGFVTKEIALNAVKIAKEEVIEKAAYWLDTNLIQYWGQLNANDTERFVEQFKKVMEE